MQRVSCAICLLLCSVLATRLSAADKPVATSPVVTVDTKGHQQKLTADVTGAKNLYLVVSDAGDGFGALHNLTPLQNF